jgi:hypothetical protein
MATGTTTSGEQFGIIDDVRTQVAEPRTKPGEWLDYSPPLTILSPR